jgi:hypothetical protein
MRSKAQVVVLAVLAGLFVYFARCRAVASANPVEHGFVPHTSVVALAHGRLGLSSYGVGLLDIGNEQILVLHVRAAVTNDGSESWSLDTSTATAVASHPIAVNANAAALPYLIVAPGERRVADLYFTIPDEDLDGFTFEWNGARSTFARGVQPVPDAGNARYWWFDPGYSWPSFHHVDGVLTRKPPTAATLIWLHDPNDSEEAGEND